MDRAVHITDGRISSESTLRPTFQRPGDAVHEEYLVVDRVGRLQLPREILDKLSIQGLAKADIIGDQVTLRPAAKRSRSGSGDGATP